MREDIRRFFSYITGIESHRPLQYRIYIYVCLESLSNKKLLHELLICPNLYFDINIMYFSHTLHISESSSTFPLSDSWLYLSSCLRWQNRCQSRCSQEGSPGNLGSRRHLHRSPEFQCNTGCHWRHDTCSHWQDDGHTHNILHDYLRKIRMDNESHKSIPHILEAILQLLVRDNEYMMYTCTCNFFVKMGKPV